MISRFLLMILVAVSLLGAIAPETAGACPMCKDAYSDGTNTPVASSFNPSIIFMIATTFIVFFGVAFRIWWSWRRHAAASATPAQSSTLPPQ